MENMSTRKKNNHLAASDWSILTCLDLDSNPGRSERQEAFNCNALHMHWYLANSVLLWPSLLYEAAPNGTEGQSDMGRGLVKLTAYQ